MERQLGGMMARLQETSFHLFRTLGAWLALKHASTVPDLDNIKLPASTGRGNYSFPSSDWSLVSQAGGAVPSDHPCKSKGHVSGGPV